MHDPLALVREHFEEASKSETFDASRAALATATAEGHPRVRYVLVRELESDGLFFYTNYRSKKAAELDANPHAALAFHWASTGIQVRARGPVTRASAERSDAYFASRERLSQLGAWASEQSAPLESRASLEARFREFEARFVGAPVPRPPHWGGYRLAPRVVEIWHDGEHRLHDRFIYVRGEAGWSKERLNP